MSASAICEGTAGPVSPLLAIWEILHMLHAAITKEDCALLREVATGKLSGIEPRETLRLLLQLQDRGLITMCATGWALTHKGKQMLEAVRQ